MMPARYVTLQVFDFDGTLFRSPHPPAGWEGRWWSSPKSLAPPFVPKEPGPGWWNQSVVDQAKVALDRGDTLCVLITARKKGFFGGRVRELLAGAGLDFPRVYMAPDDEEAEAFKIRVVTGLLEEYTSIRGVSWWEDREDHLLSFTAAVERLGRACFPHLITTPPHPVETSTARVAARYQSKKKDEEGNVHYEYGPRQVANRHKEKAERVEGLRNHISDLRTCVRKDLGAKDPHKALVALAVRLMDLTCERVGNHESAKEGHFGVTGWQKGHVTLKGDKATIKYVGKSGVDHVKVVDDAGVVKALRDLVKGKGDKDRLLERDGEGVDPSDVNEYLSKFDITAKDIRGFRANDEMCKALRKEREKGPKLPFARKDKDKILKGEFQSALEAVAEIVGHEATTLRSQYLVPGLEDTYTHDGTVLKDLTGGKKATKTRTQKEDEAAEALIRKSPKSKPPRKDLQNHRVKEDDPDFDVDRVAGAILVAARYLRAMEFETEEALKTYLEEHPDADKSKHTVKKKDDKGQGEEEGAPAGDTGPGDGEEEPDTGDDRDTEDADDEDRGDTDPDDDDGGDDDEEEVEVDQDLRALGKGNKSVSKAKANGLARLLHSVVGDDKDLKEQVVSHVQASLAEAVDSYASAISEGNYRGVVKALGGGDGAFREGDSEKRIQKLTQQRAGLSKKVDALADSVKRAERRVSSLEGKTEWGQTVRGLEREVAKVAKFPETAKAEERLKSLSGVDTKGMDPAVKAAHEKKLATAKENVKLVKAEEEAGLAEVKKELEKAKAAPKDTNEELDEAREDLEKSKESAKKLPNLQAELKKVTDNLVGQVAAHHTAVSIMSTLTEPVVDASLDPGEVRSQTVSRLKALPPEYRKEAITKANKELDAVNRKIERGTSGSGLAHLEKQRKVLEGQVQAGNLSDMLSDDNDDGGKGKGESDLVTSLVKSVNTKSRGTKYLYDMASGVKSKGFRQAVHNSTAALTDQEFVKTFENHVPERAKEMLEVLKGGTYQDDSKGGKDVTLTTDMAEYLRKSIINATLNDAGAEGVDAEEGLAPPSSGGPVKTPKSRVKSPKGTPWWRRILDRMKGRSLLKEKPYRSKSATVVATRYCLKICP